MAGWPVETTPKLRSISISVSHSRRPVPTVSPLSALPLRFQAQKQGQAEAEVEGEVKAEAEAEAQLQVRTERQTSARGPAWAGSSAFKQRQILAPTRVQAQALAQSQRERERAREREAQAPKRVQAEKPEGLLEPVTAPRTNEIQMLNAKGKNENEEVAVAGGTTDRQRQEELKVKAKAQGEERTGLMRQLITTLQEQRNMRRSTSSTHKKHPYMSKGDTKEKFTEAETQWKRLKLQLSPHSCKSGLSLKDTSTIAEPSNAALYQKSYFKNVLKLQAIRQAHDGHTTIVPPKPGRYDTAPYASSPRVTAPLGGARCPIVRSEEQDSSGNPLLNLVLNVKEQLNKDATPTHPHFYPSLDSKRLLAVSHKPPDVSAGKADENSEDPSDEQSNIKMCYFGALVQLPRSMPTHALKPASKAVPSGPNAAPRLCQQPADSKRRCGVTEESREEGRDDSPQSPHNRICCTNDEAATPPGHAPRVSTKARLLLQHNPLVQVSGDTDFRCATARGMQKQSSHSHDWKASYQTYKQARAAIRRKGA